MNDLIIFISGISQESSAWQPVIAGLQGGWTGESFAVSDLVDDDKPFTMSAAVAGVLREVNRLGAASVILCGISLGSMIATSFAIAHPERTRGLVLVDAQLRPKPALMIAELAAVSVLPGSLLGLSEHLSRRRMREIVNVASRIDYRSSLADVTVPTLVVTGDGDSSELSASREMAAALPDAELSVIPEARTELNLTHPIELGHALAEYLTGLRRS